MDKTAYEYTNKDLIDAYWKAVCQAATSNSGLVIDCAASHYANEAFYLHGVVLSRLEGIKPPFVKGDDVRINPKETYICHSVNMGPGYSFGQADLKQVGTVARVFFEKGQWTLLLKGDDGYRYPANRFEKVESKQNAA